MPDINLRVQVDGLDELLKGFQRTFTSIGPAMQRMQDRVAKRLATYPPSPPGSTYDRTGDLGRAWQMSGAVDVDALGTNLYQDRASVSLRNDVEGPSGQHYAGWVQGPQTQTEQHRRTGWETTQQVIDAETGPFLVDVSDAIEGAFRSWPGAAGR